MVGEGGEMAGAHSWVGFGWVSVCALNSPEGVLHAIGFPKVI